MSVQNCIFCVTAALGVLIDAAAAGATGQTPCPTPSESPLLTIADLDDSVVPLVDSWQVLWRGVPLSDAQVARLAGDETWIAKTDEEMADRGGWVFVGMGTVAAGAAVSSAGWVLYGQNELSQGVTVPLAIGGLVVGIVGILIVTHNIQSALEPHVAPTPEHRMTREEMTGLVAAINHTLQAAACPAKPRDSVGAPDVAGNGGLTVLPAPGPRRAGWLVRTP